MIDFAPLFQLDGVRDLFPADGAPRYYLRTTVFGHSTWARVQDLLPIAQMEGVCVDFTRVRENATPFASREYARALADMMPSAVCTVEEVVS